MIAWLRFLGGLGSAALQWLAGLTCMSPVFFFLFYEAGRLSTLPALLLVGFLLLDSLIVWLLGAVMRQVAPSASQSEPFGYGQTMIGALLCFWGIAKSTRAASMEFASLYSLLSLFVPGVVLLVYGVRVLMMAYLLADE